MKTHKLRRARVGIFLMAAIAGIFPAQSFAEEVSNYSVITSVSVRNVDVAPTTRPAVVRTDFEHVTRAFDRIFKRLMKQVKDDDRIDSSLLMVVELEQITISAKSLTPEHIEKLPENLRYDSLAEHIELLDNLIASLTELESGLVEREGTKIDEAVRSIDEILPALNKK